MRWYSCCIWRYLRKVGFYQDLHGAAWSSAGKASPSEAYLGLREALMLWFWPCGPRARVSALPFHAGCFNEDGRRRWWRVNYNLMLESKTISPFITPRRRGLTRSCGASSVCGSCPCWPSSADFSLESSKLEEPSCVQRLFYKNSCSSSLIWAVRVCIRRKCLNINNTFYTTK